MPAKNTKHTCFVIMPFGERKDGKTDALVDFDAVYKHIIKETANKLKLRVIRCDEISSPGLIHRDMLEHIFDDDVAIVDITTLNPNVFYELGVRHALRRSVTVLMRQKGTSIPFNITGVRVLEYSTDLSGAAKARQELEEAIRQGLAESLNDSLVHEVLRNLQVSRVTP